MKRFVILMLIVFIISISGLFLIHLKTEFYKLYLNSIFWSLGGTSFGTLLGIYSREKNNRIIPKKSFISILIICICAIVISFTAFYFFGEDSLYGILILNIVGLIISIGILIKPRK
jgi:hypothetical protein